MKVTIVALLVCFSAVSLHAQTRRRGGVLPDPGGSNWGSIDSSDPIAAARLRMESDPAAAAAAHPGDPIPVTQLRIPSKATKEFARAEKAFQSGDIPTSAEHLQKALEIYPDYLQAHNSLGLRYVQLGQYQKALAEHQLALALNPRNAQTHQDIALALVLLNRAPESENEARLALDLDSQSVGARYVLGRALIAQHHVTAEALDMLSQSENAFPNASLVLAQIHFTAGRTEQVIAELRKYLRAPVDLENKQKAECWVAQLSQQPLPSGCSASVARPAFR